MTCNTFASFADYVMLARLDQEESGEPIVFHRQRENLAHDLSETCPCHPFVIPIDDDRNATEIAADIFPHLGSS